MSRQPSALRELCGELEDMSVWKDEVKIVEVRIRLEDAVAEAEAHEKHLLETIRGMETTQMVRSNIETMRDFYAEGLRRAGRAVEAGNTVLATRTICAALGFHPMHAESWPGWPEEEK